MNLSDMEEGYQHNKSRETLQQLLMHRNSNNED